MSFISKNRTISSLFRRIFPFVDLPFSHTDRLIRVILSLATIDIFDELNSISIGQFGGFEPR